MNLIIRPESSADLEAIRHVNRMAFRGEAEARLVDALRDGGWLWLSLVAERGGLVTGHILFSHLPIETPSEVVSALALAPLAVLPQCQRQGIGSKLIRDGLEACRRGGHRIVVVLGDPSYYGRFGFSTGLAQPLESPYSGEAFMALELEPGALGDVAGRVIYPPPFTAGPL